MLVLVMQLVSRIIQATEHPEAVDAFASIVLSPEAELSFEEMVQGLSCPVCLAYGAPFFVSALLWGSWLVVSAAEINQRAHVAVG